MSGCGAVVGLINESVYQLHNRLSLLLCGTKMLLHFKCHCFQRRFRNCQTKPIFLGFIMIWTVGIILFLEVKHIKTTFDVLRGENVDFWPMWPNFMKTM